MKLQAMDERPLYQQLKSIIKNDIENSVYKRGERIPTEIELTRLYNVSRNTVRGAISALEKEGLLTRKQGKGTFVTPEKMYRPLEKTRVTRSFSEMCREIGRKPGAKVIKSVIEDATERDIAYLGTSPEERVIVIGRIRYADDLPVSVEISRFPGRFEFLLRENLNDCSMFELLRDRYNITFATAHMTLEMVFSSYEISRYLGLGEGYPLLHLDSLLTDREDRPACHSLQYIVGDRFKMVL